MNLNKTENKTIVKMITVLVLALGSFSLIQFLMILHDMFFSGGMPSVLGFFSIFAVSKKVLSILGVFYLAAALFSFRAFLKRSFFLFTYTAWSQLILFSVGFMAFGIFCGPAGALPHLVFACAIVALAASSKIRSAFDSDTPEYKRQYKVLARIFACIVIIYGLYMAHFAMKYPYVFSTPGAASDYRKTSLFAEDIDTSATTEIYGFKILIPSGFSLSGVVHEYACGDVGAYDKALFSCGSDQILLTTKNGILIEQLYPMTATFDVKTSYEYLTDYINDRYGIVWMTVKSLAQYEYSGFSADGWHGYIEDGPFLSGGGYLAKNFNIWNDDPAAGSRLELSFFFKNGGPSPSLVSKILSSLRVSKAPPAFLDVMRTAIAEMDSNRFETALIFLADALSKDYKSADAHYYMARCFISQSRPDKKNYLKHIEEALKINPAHKKSLELKSNTKI